MVWRSREAGGFARAKKSARGKGAVGGGAEFYGKAGFGSDRTTCKSTQTPLLPRYFLSTGFRMVLRQSSTSKSLSGPNLLTPENQPMRFFR